MGDVLQFRKPKPSEKFKGHTLCNRGFHKWELLKDQTFDTKQGKLITTHRCQRCGELKSESR